MTGLEIFMAIVVVITIVIPSAVVGFYGVTMGYTAAKEGEPHAAVGLWFVAMVFVGIAAVSAFSIRQERSGQQGVGSIKSDVVTVSAPGTAEAVPVEPVRRNCICQCEGDR